jgi:hypothetical protein
MFVAHRVFFGYKGSFFSNKLSAWTNSTQALQYLTYQQLI